MIVTWINYLIYLADVSSGVHAQFVGVSIKNGMGWNSVIEYAVMIRLDMKLICSSHCYDVEDNEKTR